MTATVTDHHGHDHQHPHPHGHVADEHGHTGEQHLTGAGTSERAFGGPVTVEVGDGAGALVVYLDNNWLDDEIHLHPTDPGQRSTHTGVWVRRTPSGDVVAAVFGTLPTGTYTLVDRDQITALATVDLDDATVTEIDLRRKP